MTLTRRQYWGILLIGVVVFLLIDDLWANPFAIDGSIIWSYAVVALLVPVALLANKTFTVLNLLLAELEIILLKYAITTCIAVGFWASTDPPPHTVVPPPRHETRAERQPPEPTRIDTTIVGAVVGVVTVDRKPVEGAMVFIDSGLDDLSYIVPNAPLVLTNDGAGLTPKLAVLRTYQHLELVVNDGQLHTIEATTERGERAFSIPMVPTKRVRPFRTAREISLVTLRCRVHENEGRSAPAHLAVLAHPFHTVTDASGTFSFRGIPGPRLVTIRAFDGVRNGRVAVSVSPRLVEKIKVEVTADGPETSPVGR